VFAMPSTGEGFGIVFLEAMACGCPVLAGNCDGSADALADGKLGELVDPVDNSAISSALGRLLRKEGPSFWYQPELLRKEMLKRFGRRVFQNRVRNEIAQVSSV